MVVLLVQIKSKYRGLHIKGKQMSRSEQQKIYRERNKEKEAARKKKWRAENPDKIKKHREKYSTTKNKLQKIHKEACHKNWLKILLANCRLRHKQSSHINCEITIEDLIEIYEKQQGLCALTKVKMDHKVALNSISIDRKDNNLGYTKENVHLVTKWINVGRRTATLEEIQKAIQEIINTNR